MLEISVLPTDSGDFSGTLARNDTGFPRLVAAAPAR
jgi:hypothetical protein